ncbi:MAG TPA: FAD-dependent oxidoreductase [Gaiellales bacterium]|jgi:sarcosine oxidase|nr:FAD-dependent oxidoreductase [Gaiellales bacterium]
MKIVVIGLGVIGLSAAVELARRGHQVAGVERYEIGHPLGSSTGASRSIRSAYALPEYVRLSVQAIDAWHDLEQAEGRTILHLTGQIDLGAASVLDPMRAAMRAVGVAHEDIDGDGVRARFPELRSAPDEVAVFHPGAGTVLADQGMAALRAAAERAGVEIACGEAVTGLDERGNGVRVISDRGVRDADLAVLATGPWAGELLGALGLDLPLAPALAQVTFFDWPGMVGRPALSDWEAFPDGTGGYGHPVPGVGYKLGFDAAGTQPWRADAEGWEADPAEFGALVEWMRGRFPGLEPAVIRTQRHPWTMTPDGDWVIDRVGSVLLACGCSGHAFKFGPALGALVADAAEDRPRDDRRLFVLDRPGLREPAPAPSIPINR